jgi:uncharacterized protein YecT (DUF1311 family)
MPLLLPFLLLIESPAPPPPPSDHPIEACVGDDRGYTLCVAEADFERAELEMNRQWAVTISHVQTGKGSTAARYLRNEQRKWIGNRSRQCEALAAASPVTQQGRNQMSCMARLTEQRTAQLKAMAQSM